MVHLTFDVSLLQLACPRLGVASGGKYNGYFFFGDDLHVIFYSRHKQRHIHCEGPVCSGLALSDVVSQDVRVHAACAENSQTASITEQVDVRS